jgi:hypothetical protein
MELHHHVPEARLTRRYFRRWWYWKGISRARLHAIHPETELGLDLRRVPRINGVPRFAFGEVFGHARKLCTSALRRDPVRTAEEEMMLMYSVGYVLETWRGKKASAKGISDEPPGGIPGSLGTRRRSLDRPSAPLPPRAEEARGVPEPGLVKGPAMEAAKPSSRL